MPHLRLPIAIALTLGCAACMPSPKRSGPPPSAAKLAELWVDPGSQPRNLFNGVGGGAPKPAVDGRYTVTSRDTTGFSISYHVRDENGREWSAKIGPEAQPEVVASRVLWAVGYHQPPTYFVERWIAVTNGHGQVLGGARFRPHGSALGLRPAGSWSWQRDPFVGTHPYSGLIVLLMILNDSDLNNRQNEIYDVLDGPREGASRWYVVKDLGASLGESGRVDPRRGYIEGFEREPFITGVEDGLVRFGFRGRRYHLLEHITVDDVRWTCERVRRITDGQWRDAFRAGGYDDELTTRFIARIKQKVDQGLALK